jgi:hypothetical protein
MNGLNSYEVVVEHPVETTHQVTMSPEYYQSLCSSQVTHEWLIIQAFKFLLEREPNTAILARFDISEISGYFPEFEADLKRRLGV